MTPSVFQGLRVLSLSLLLQSDGNLVRGKVFTCEQSLAPITEHPATGTTPPAPEAALAGSPPTAGTTLGTRSTTPSTFATPLSYASTPPNMLAAAPDFTGARLGNTRAGLSPHQPSSPGPLPTKELACKSEPSEKTFAFCVAESCTGTATCEGCRSDFGMMMKVKCMAYNIQDQRNFCQDIKGIKFLCVGRCVARTACATCEYDNVRKTKAFDPPWGREMSLPPFLMARSQASQNTPSPAWMIFIMAATKLVCYSLVF